MQFVFMVNSNATVKDWKKLGKGIKVGLKTTTRDNGKMKSQEPQRIYESWGKNRKMEVKWVA